MEVFEWLRFMIGTAVLLCGLAIFVIEIYGIFQIGRASCRERVSLWV